MIFLKMPVGMRKTATLTMEKTVRGGTIFRIAEELVNIRMYACVSVCLRDKWCQFKCQKKSN